MAHTLPELPWPKDALAPTISAETIDYHYGKHHKAYVDKLNAAIEGTDKAGLSLEELVRTTEGGLFNNAAQTWNHTFYWHCLSPNGGGAPGGAVGDAIASAFGSFDAFREAFSTQAAGLFGSGWTWLVKSASGGIEIVNEPNAGNPMTSGHTPLLTLDVWEHAYYVDYRNARPKYIEAFWKLVDWDFVSKNLAG